MALRFNNGLAVIKSGRKTIAKVYDRKEFFKGTRYENSFQFPFSVEIMGGLFECVNKEECQTIIEKYA